MLHSVLAFFSRVLFPDFCIDCGTYGSVCCSPCWNRIRIAGAAESPHILASVCYRNELVKKCIKTIKVRAENQLIRTMVTRMVQDCSDFLYENSATHAVNSYIVVPVPLSQSRMTERGFNQSELIAAEFVQQSPVACSIVADAIQRRDIGRAKQSTTHSRGERFASLRDAFTVTRPETIIGKHILLIDDVTTTGATLLELRNALLATGARTVLCLALAH